MILPVSLNILSQAAKLSGIAKREQTNKLCNNVFRQELDIIISK
jgi:hypothetical protein